MTTLGHFRVSKNIYPKPEQLCQPLRKMPKFEKAPTQKLILQIGTQVVT